MAFFAQRFHRLGQLLVIDAAAHQAVGVGRSLINPREAGADSAPILMRLHALRTLDRRRVLPELILILGQLPEAQLEVQARRHALRKLERAVVQVAAVLAPGPLGAPAGGSVQRTALGQGRSAALSLRSVVSWLERLFSSRLPCRGS